MFILITVLPAQASQLMGSESPPLPITFTPVSNISEGCATVLAALQAGLQQGGAWAVKMIDSSGRPGPGFLQGNFLWLGRFSECEAAGMPGGSKFYLINSALSTKQVVEKKEVPGMPGMPGVPGVPGGPMQVKQGVCLPASCSEEDVSLLALEAVEAIDHFLGSVNVTSLAIVYEAVVDVSEDKDFFGSIYAVSRFCAIFLFVLVVVMSTILDLLGYEDIALHPYQELRELDAEEGNEKTPEDLEEEVEITRDVSESALSESSASLSDCESEHNSCPHDVIEVITLRENEPNTQIAKSSDETEIVVEEEENVEDEEEHVVEEKDEEPEERTHVVEVHVTTTEQSPGPEVVR